MKTILFVVLSMALSAQAQFQNPRGARGGQGGWNRPPVQPPTCPQDFSPQLEKQIIALVEQVSDAVGPVPDYMQKHLDNYVSDLHKCKRWASEGRMDYLDCITKSSQAAVVYAFKVVNDFKKDQASPGLSPRNSSGMKTCTVDLRESNGHAYVHDQANLNLGNFLQIHQGAKLTLISSEPIYYQGAQYEGFRLRVESNPSETPRDAKPGQIVWDFKTKYSDYGCKF